MGLFGPPNVERMETNKDVKGLVKALGYRKDLSVCQAAAEALVRIGEPAVVALIDVLADLKRPSYVRLLAIWALGEIGDFRAVPFLSLALNDLDDSIRQAAADTYKRLAGYRPFLPPR